MRINRIELNNIGSYEGLNVFNIAQNNTEGKITVIGGKNGAGKTTLFTAIKLCLYGYKEYGYSSVNAYYKRNIKKLINDKAKIENEGTAQVALTIEIFNGQEWDEYLLARKWDLASEFFEKFEVLKNGRRLTEEELVDFDNYLLNLIPPELFDLYFFDGEQIADFFLEDTNGEKVKKAFLTICGYDTFNIINKNFKRIGKAFSSEGDALAAYFEIEDKLSEEERTQKTILNELEEINNSIEQVNAELAGLDSDYVNKGGISLEEWNKNTLSLQNEERIREEKNQIIKSAANEKIPFIILKDEIKELDSRIDEEENLEQVSAFMTMLSALLPTALDDAQKKVSGFTDDMKKQVYSFLVKKGKKLSKTNVKTILNLSNQERNSIKVQIANLLDIHNSEIIDLREDIKKSIIRSQVKREEIEKSSIAHIEDYLTQKEECMVDKKNLIDRLEMNSKKLKEQEELVNQLQARYKVAEKNLEKQLKNDSITSLTTKSILFLEELQKRLFDSEIKRVEELFMEKINQLMRKEQFISRIEIDDNFIVHVYKQVSIDCNGVCEKIRESSVKEYIEEYGQVHCDDIIKASGCKSLEEFAWKYAGKNQVLDVVVELDKTTMSKGEKQVFIMALYWAIMQLSNKEVPFIIDTPFARIDKEHRNHITEKFFNDLKGQVFIFSTNEEITTKHLKKFGKNLQGTFLIENNDNTRTIIKENSYFGE